MITAPQTALVWAIFMLLGSLVIGTIARFIALRSASEETRRKRFASLRTWWMLAIAVSAALLLGRLGVCLLLAVASCIAWKEITGMAGLRAVDHSAIRAGYALIVFNYGLILFEATSVFVVFLPIAAMFTLAILLLIKDEANGYIRSAGTLLWGIMFLGYGVSHAAYLFVLPQASTSAAPLGPAGWFLFLVILTETDDIFQAVIGRLFGAHKRHRIAPVISPNKTWEGFFGGMLVIVVLAPLLAPWLTSLNQMPGPFGITGGMQQIAGPIVAALLISCAGFFGDINMSAVKRDSGVKDSSSLLPGMGGVIDRVDSLTFTAPVFVYFLIWWQT